MDIGIEIDIDINMFIYIRQQINHGLFRNTTNIFKFS